jgi:hypothetical protein
MRRCFLLSLSIDLHIESTNQTSERAIAGVTHGLIGPGESVTWRGRHFGVMLTQTSRITVYEAPTHFQDTMTRGLFRSFVHDHFFEEGRDGATTMSDVLRFAAPLKPLGLFAERFVLRGYLERFLRERNDVIRHVAESRTDWKRYIDGDMRDAAKSE